MRSLFPSKNYFHKVIFRRGTGLFWRKHCAESQINSPISLFWKETSVSKGNLFINVFICSFNSRFPSLFGRKDWCSGNISYGRFSVPIAAELQVTLSEFFMIFLRPFTRMSERYLKKAMTTFFQVFTCSVFMINFPSVSSETLQLINQRTYWLHE